MRAWRNKLQIDRRCPDAERFEGKIHPLFFVSQRRRRISKTRWLIGTSHAAFPIEIFDAHPKEFSFISHSGVTHQYDDVPKKFLCTAPPSAPRTCSHGSLVSYWFFIGSD